MLRQTATSRNTEVPPSPAIKSGEDTSSGGNAASPTGLAMRGKGTLIHIKIGGYDSGLWRISDDDLQFCDGRTDTSQPN